MVAESIVSLSQKKKTEQRRKTYLKIMESFKRERISEDFKHYF